MLGPIRTRKTKALVVIVSNYKDHQCHHLSAFFLLPFIIYLTNSIEKGQNDNFIQGKKRIHCNGVPAESVENVGGACKIQNQLGGAGVRHIFNLQNIFVNQVYFPAEEEGVGNGGETCLAVNNGCDGKIPSGVSGHAQPKE